MFDRRAQSLGRGLSGGGPLDRRRRQGVRVASFGLLVAVGLAACGGSGSKGTAATGTGTGGSDAKVDKTIQTLLEAGSGQRGAKEDAPGKIRFLNLLARNGGPVNVDIWWGRPDEKVKAASVRYGEATDYLTPKRAKGFDSAVYTVTVADGTEELWTWDRFTPKSNTQRTAIFSFDNGSLSEASLEEALDAVSPYTNRVDLPAPDAGKVRLLWRVVGKGIDSGNDLLAVMAGDTCLTNGSGIAGPDRNQLGNEMSFQVAPGTSLALHPNCEGSAASSAVKAPSGGRGLLLAYKDRADKSQLLVLPVKG